MVVEAALALRRSAAAQVVELATPIAVLLRSDRMLSWAGLWYATSVSDPFVAKLISLVIILLI